MARALDDLPYRPCVGIALFNANGHVFVGRRKDAQDGSEEMRAAWQMPQGGIDPGEDPYEAAIRELHEETGISSIAPLGEAPDWLDYDLPPELLGKVWKGRFRGQTQKWFAFRFTGLESEINIHAPPGGHEPEFVEWRWRALAEIPATIVAFKRPVYREVARIFARFAAGDATVIRGSSQ
jgi:putative (di)nucleoside polyphosphate hydrolase